MLVLVSTPVKVLAAKVHASGMLRSWSTPEPCLPVLLAAQDTFIKLNVLRNDFVRCCNDRWPTRSEKRAILVKNYVQLGH